MTTTKARRFVLMTVPFTTRGWGFPLIGLSLLLLNGCFTPRTTEAMRVETLKAVMNNDHSTAVGTINELYESHYVGDIPAVGSSPATSDKINAKQSLVWHMERGLVDHLFGDLQSSNLHLDKAGELVDERRTKTLVTEVGTFVSNDTIRDFPGTAFEHTQVDYYRALNRVLQAEQREGIYLPTHILVPPPPKPNERKPTETALWTLNGNDGVSAADNYDRAINFSRRMTINQLQETKEAAGSHRYNDDPFARFLSAALTYTPKIGDRAEANRQFADVMLKRAMEGYSKQAEVLSGQQPFRYEVPRRPDSVERLYIRHCRAYDPDGFDGSLSQYGISTNDPRIQRATLPPGYGSVLVLNHVGYITHPEVLDIRIVAAQFSGTQSPTPADAARGHTSSKFYIGAVAFWATGPGSEVVKTWGAVPIPSNLVQQLIAPGGAAFIGFALPVHDADHPILPPGSVRARPAGATSSGNDFSQPLEILTDLDAYARATLKDDQPGILAKTMIRTAAKQAAVAVASHQVEKQYRDKDGVGQLLGLAVNLIGSTVMTLSEVADTRAWTTLPDHITGTLMDLPAGRYALTLDTALGPVECGGVTVEPGRVVVVPVRTFPDPLRYRSDK